MFDEAVLHMCGARADAGVIQYNCSNLLWCCSPLHIQPQLPSQSRYRKAVWHFPLLLTCSFILQVMYGLSFKKKYSEYHQRREPNDILQAERTSADYAACLSPSTPKNTHRPGSFWLQINIVHHNWSLENPALVVLNLQLFWYATLSVDMEMFIWQTSLC